MHHRRSAPGRILSRIASIVGTAALAGGTAQAAATVEAGWYVGASAGRSDAAFDDGSGEYDEDQVGILVGPGYSIGQQLSPRWKVERVGKVQPTERGLAYFLEQWERALLAIHTHTVEDGEYEAFAYVENVSWPDCSEYGYIYVKPSVGGLVRTA